MIQDARDVKKLHHAFNFLLIIFVLLVGLGTINIFSSTLAVDREQFGISYYHLIRQGVFLVLGIGVAVFTYSLNYRKLRLKGVGAYLLSLALLILVLIIGTQANGAQRWLSFGGLSFQPSELAKVAAILFTADCLKVVHDSKKTPEFAYSINDFRGKRKRKGNASSQGFQIYNPLTYPVIPHPVLMATFILSFLVLRQPDAGTAIVISLMPILMLWISGASVRKVLPILCVLAPIILFELTHGASYRRDRITAWENPWLYQKDLGYQSVQALIAIGSGGILGQGIGQGLSKFSYLPEAHTDFAFAVLAQEWGLLGSLLVLILYLGLIYYGYYITVHMRDFYGKMLAFGVTIYFGDQGLINIAMVCNILPVVGVPLPFISYGGTSLVINFFAAALLLNVAHRCVKDAEKMVALRQNPIMVKSMRRDARNHFPLH